MLHYMQRSQHTLPSGLPCIAPRCCHVMDDPAARVMNVTALDSILLLSLLFSPRQTVAGRMLQPPHQWLHLQKDLEAFTLTPPTDPPLPPHPPSSSSSTTTSAATVPHPPIPPAPSGLDVTYVVTKQETSGVGEGGWGLGWRSHHYGQISTFPIWTTVTPLAACVGDS